MCFPMTRSEIRCGYHSPIWRSRLGGPCTGRRGEAVGEPFAASVHYFDAVAVLPDAT